MKRYYICGVAKINCKCQASIYLKFIKVTPKIKDQENKKYEINNKINE